MTPLMWFCTAVFRSVALRLETHAGSCECHTSTRPRIGAPIEAALAAMVSALTKLNVPRFGSVASHFNSLSGVTMVNSVARRELYVESLRLLAPTAVPKKRPLVAAAAPRPAAACAEVKIVTARVAPSRLAAPRTRAVRRRRDVLSGGLA